jgi:uncharacterized protein YndB with AHSA1/START domain
MTGPSDEPVPVTIGRGLRLSAEDVWDLMWRVESQPQWLGRDSTLPPLKNRQLLLADVTGVWRTGRVQKVVPHRLLTATLAPRATWDTAASTTLEIEIVGGDPAAGAEVSVRVRETGALSDAQRSEIDDFWKAALDRLQDLVSAVRRRRDAPRQAVVIIHGIGEQLPGATLRHVAESGVLGKMDEASFVKPDRVSGSFELRQITFSATEDRACPTTDAFELYWANVIRDTTLAQVGAWLRGLLLRRRVPRPLRPLWLLGWLILLAVVVGSALELFGVWHLPRWLAAGGVVAVIAGLLWQVIARPVAINVLGDAARYLSPKPGNVAARQAIRQAGVDLLDRLHRRGNYDRIVVLGHSLGSVIAYDVLTFAWIEQYRAHDRPSAPRFNDIRAVERAAGTEPDPVIGQGLQHEAWTQMRRNTQPWLVTDLVTVGSPLTYADFLMASNQRQFDAAKRDRVLPTAPPVTQVERQSGHHRCSFDFSYTGDPTTKQQTMTTFDHAALFGATRWTNLYFEMRGGGLIGDLVGGPVAPQFGHWVRDVPLASPVRRFSHTCYWARVGNERHLDALREALRMDSGRELLALGRSIPAHAALTSAHRS